MIVKMKNINMWSKALNCRTAQIRHFKNFGHNEPKEPLYQKIYATFIVLPFAFLPVDWKFFKEGIIDFVTFSVPRVPERYKKQEDD